MENIASFMKISEKQFWKDKDLFLKDMAVLDMLGWEESHLQDVRKRLKLPKRSTASSAGYDICSTRNIKVKAGEPFVIPTGLRCQIKQGWVLIIFPRSGLSFKYGTRLVNTLGVIDADYYLAENEGHIILKFIADQDFEILEGDRIAQGIFLPFGVTRSDNAFGRRTGGFGSTGV